MVGLSFRMFKGDRIRIIGILLGEMELHAMGAHRIELGMPMQVKENRSSVIIVMGLDILHVTALSQSVHQNSDYFKDKMLLMQAQENGAVLDEEEWYGYQEKDKNKDKSGQNQARDWKEHENTNPM
ncbi:hypothetical protein Tco_0100547, partial [Tanacetum coccineum]